MSWEKFNIEKQLYPKKEGLYLYYCIQSGKIGLFEIRFYKLALRQYDMRYHIIENDKIAYIYFQECNIPKEKEINYFYKLEIELP